MPYRSRRRSSGSGIGRGGVVALLVGAVIIFGALWLGPMRPLPAELQLLALANGEFAETVQPPTLAPDTFDARAGIIARAPIVLGVRNVGARAAAPATLHLSLPARFRLAGADGAPLPVRRVPGSSLVQYSFEIAAPALKPRAEPVPLPGVDTLWIEHVRPEYDCTLIGESVPDFQAAPRYDATTLADLRLFYSFDDRASGVRQSGLLTVQLDASLLDREPAAAPPRGAVTMHADDAPRPDLGPLTQAGTRTALCGDPETPVEMRTVLWAGAGATRLYEIHVHDTPRKLLYDTTGDGTIDLEIWDAEGHGRFRSRREARYAVPSFVQPLPTRAERFAAAIDADTDVAALAVDSVWLARFHAPHAGPFRFAADTDAAVAGAPLAAAPPHLTEPEPVDSTWLARFHDTGSGPFRFAAVPPPAVTPPTAAEPGAPAPGTPAPGTPAAPPAVAAEPEAQPDTVAPAPARREPPRLLGRPVDWPPPQRDTIPDTEPEIR